MPKISLLEERHHGCSTSYIVLATEQVNSKIIPLFRKGVGKKTFICKYLCMTKYITYVSSAIWTQSPDLTDLGIKWSKYTHIKPFFLLLYFYLRCHVDPSHFRELHHFMNRFNSFLYLGI